jgi:hypothetical protein
VVATTSCVAPSSDERFHGALAAAAPLLLEQQQPVIGERERCEGHGHAAAHVRRQLRAPHQVQLQQLQQRVQRCPGEFGSGLQPAPPH